MKLVCLFCIILVILIVNGDDRADINPMIAQSTYRRRRNLDIPIKLFRKKVAIYTYFKARTYLKIKDTKIKSSIL